jgi:hypothetical protein
MTLFIMLNRCDVENVSDTINLVWLSSAISDSVYIFHTGRSSVLGAALIVMPGYVVQMKTEYKCTVI